MMYMGTVALFNLHAISLAHGGPPLLDRADLIIERGERVCLLGRNGTGKSTLLRLIHGEIVADDGRIDRAPGARTAMLPQEVPTGATGTVADLVSRPDALPADEEPWELRRRTEVVLDGLGLDRAAPVATLSGGMRRRAFLARALIARPDLLLLDEPTNHLDIGAILWLERYLERFGGTTLFVSHDRMFIDHLATRIVELDRGRLASYPGSHAAYRARRAEELAVEEAHRAAFDRRLAREEAWIRQGIRARRTRNEGRVRALVAMREERRARRERMGSVRLRLEESERSGKLVLVARDLTFGYGDGPPIVRGLSTAVLRGDRVGVIGPNGCGKTTLLRLLLGQLAPRGGHVRHGTRLEIAYLDQLRAQLRDDRTVADNVADGADTVQIGGNKARSIYAYLQDFLFTPDRARSPASVLSGGERNRLLLARLFARTSNVIVLDEPTNDLDTDTLELLEERLLDYRGTLLLVSHDRTFLDNVVTSTLAFEGDGVVREVVGGYSDWRRQRGEVDGAPSREPAAHDPPPRGRRRARPRVRKLTYAEGMELEALPGRIEEAEAGRDALQQRMADPDFYRQSPDAIREARARLTEAEERLEELYGRWEELEEIASRSS